jgi:hypothetical protein
MLVEIDKSNWNQSDFYFNLARRENMAGSSLPRNLPASCVLLISHPARLQCYACTQVEELRYTKCGYLFVLVSVQRAHGRAQGVSVR